MKFFRSASIVCALGLASALAGPAHAQAATDLTCSLCVSNGELANNAVRSSKIYDGSVTSADLAKNSVTGTHIISRAVTYNKLDLGVRRSLDNAISNMTTAIAEDAAIGVAGADCPSGRIAVSASCVCDDDGGNSNNGVLFACAVDGNGAIAACFDEAGTFNPVKESPVAIVQAICLGADTSDGTPWVPAASGTIASSASPGDQKRTPEAEAAWHKQQHDRFVAALAAFKQKQAAHRTLMQSR